MHYKHSHLLTVPGFLASLGSVPSSLLSWPWQLARAGSEDREIVSLKCKLFHTLGHLTQCGQIGRFCTLGDFLISLAIIFGKMVQNWSKCLNCNLLATMATMI